MSDLFGTSGSPQDEQLRERLAVPGADRAARYPARWLLDGAMGPNPLWLAETLVEAMDLTSGMRVLDLGCGRALTSVFLAREYGVTVTAADLWIDPGPNWQRVLAAGVGDRVFPVKAEAHTLPFAEGSFDAIVCVDAFEYFGTDERYIAYLSRFVKPGGQIGVSMPAFTAELPNGLPGEPPGASHVPEWLRDTWDWEFHSWHSPEWWRQMWTRSGHIEVECAELLPDGAAHWLNWERVQVDSGVPGAEQVARMLAVDAGRTIGFGQLVARRPEIEAGSDAPPPAPPTERTPVAPPSPALTERMRPSRFPRSARHDAKWQLDNRMGPNPLWLAEWLRPAMDLAPGSRVLDLGCGSALTSVFLAEEYDVEVVAADLRGDQDDNARRIRAAGVADRVFPIRVEAHDLPFAPGYFDAVVSIDAYHYFGTDQLYLAYLAQFLRPGGQLGIVVPGLVEELPGDEPSEHLKPWWVPDCWSFHSPAWWRRLWTRDGAVEVETADLLKDGWRYWTQWNEVCAEAIDPGGSDEVADLRREAEALRRDAGRSLGFSRVVGRKPVG